MTGESTVKVTLALKDPDLEEERLDRTTRNLLRDIKDLDGVEQAGLVSPEEMPEGAKAFGGTLLGIMTAEVSLQNIKALLGFVGDRLGDKPIEIELEANGKKLKIKASSKQELVTAHEEIVKPFFASLAC